ncbi:hypothetical protein L6164_009292 [Bauhinia variegata]|uniref:Uncharacterized protein n=1 Tax=Bauhinia variegata TaxID=167791 RepID=A0ACB9PI81_BAUVA|nr:hypothetical protein L6164_009292 [Bauhinia variegata]
MICAKGKKQMALVILSLILLALLQLRTPCNAAGKSRFKIASTSHLKPSKFHGGLKGNADNKDKSDDLFGADKRKVHTGPNPLHNR